MHRTISILAICLLCSSCLSLDARSTHNLISIAALSGFTYQQVSMESFQLATLQKSSNKNSDSPLHVYIEGDGRAWINRKTPASDPTPKDAIALKLAMQDPTPNIIYLARPCQFIIHLNNEHCDNSLWTSHRYSQQVVNVLDQAITTIIDNQKIKNKKLRLFGYSGGGTLAALIASQRNDIDLLVTIAANIDHQAWTTFHNDSPLIGSLNPPDYAAQLATTPQIHFIGEYDNVVPRSILDSYLKQVSPITTQLHVLKNHDHRCCWINSWQELIANIE
jgi:hypothetical protein